MSMVRSSVKVDADASPVRTTTKILNLYNKSADPGNKTGSMVVTLPPGIDSTNLDMMDPMDASEITVIFEDEIETLYVGPVEISEEEAAAVAALERDQGRAGGRQSGGGNGVSNGGSKKNAPGTSLLINNNSNTSEPVRTLVINHHHQQANGPASPAASGANKLASPGASNGSDSGIDNCSRRNVKRGRKSQTEPKDVKKSPSEKPEPTVMVIKRRGRPPGSTTKPQAATKPEKSPAMTTKRPPTEQQTETAVRKTTRPAATVSPKQQFECELCEEVFSREDTIVDHYQSYHRVDPKKRTIKPRVNIPAEDGGRVAAPGGDGEAAVVDVIQQRDEEEDEDDDDQEREAEIAVTAEPKPVVVEKPKEKKTSPGLICGKCNLNFRTILLLGRHINQVHQADGDEDDEEDEEEEDNDEEEPIAQPAKNPKAAVEEEKPKRPRGRPRKSPPRILNVEKPLGTRSARLAAAVKSDSSPAARPEKSLLLNSAASPLEAADEQSPASVGRPRGRKRKPSSFAEDDNENEVVPKPKPTKRMAHTRGAAQQQQLQSPIKSDEEMIFVEVLDEKGNTFVEQIGAPEESPPAAAVYKIKECKTVDKDGTKKYACPICDVTFTRRYSLDPHIKRVHQKLRTKECQHCDRKFLATGDLTRHMAIHTGDKPFPCSIPGCPYRFVSRSDQAKHELRHTAGVPRTYVCGQCEMAFERPYDLRRHQTTHKDLIGQVDFRSYKCEQCHREFTRKDEYRAHMYRHLGVKPLKCHVCGKPFVDQSNCAKHCKGHGPLTHGGSADSLVCADCGQRFTNQSALGRHLTKCLHERSALPVHTVPQWDYFEGDVK